MNRQRGFTLIELVIVIVILGILAVTAAPQFFNFGADARESTLRGLQGSLNGSVDLVYGRAAIAGVEREADTEITLNGVDVPISFGYPNFTAATTVAAGEAAIFAVLNISEADWEYSFAAGGELRIAPVGRNGTVTPATLTSIDQCFLSYTAASGLGARPTVAITNTGC